ncbi:MAG: hypothetical protein AAGI10_11775 [Pseudomonadota bacterium]
MAEHLSKVVRTRLATAAHKMGTADPGRYMGRALDEAFDLPAGDPRYGENALSPGAAPLEPSFSEAEPYGLRFTMEPLGPHGSPSIKKQEASRILRSMIAPCFGRDALYWFDRVSEDHRGTGAGAGDRFGAWIGAGFDRDGLYSAKAYYETREDQLAGLPQPLKGYVEQARASMPQLRPVFSTVTTRMRSGRQRITFRVGGAIRTEDFQPLLDSFGMGDLMAQLTRLFGLALGGSFEAPDGSILLGIAAGADGPELKVELLIAAIPQVPDSFVDLLRLGLSERPRHLRALDNWMGAFTPEGSDLPGDFSVMSIKLTRSNPAQVSLYLRPMGFEIGEPAL